jgi:hypothetical protein
VIEERKKIYLSRNSLTWKIANAFFQETFVEHLAAELSS